jgi:hypothetical protein
VIRKGIRPALRFGFERALEGEFYRRVFPFRKSWPAVVIVLAMDVVFMIPAISTFGQISGGLSRFESLFDVVGILFLSGWLLGWSLAPLGLTTVLLLMLFGRETVRVAPGHVEVAIGIPGIGLLMRFESGRIRNLRVETPQQKTGKSWRGAHFTFDYGANSGSFGSDVSLGDMGELESVIRRSSGKSPRTGEAFPEELEGEWRKNPLRDDPEEKKEPAVANSPGAWLTVSTLALLVANLVPVAGALFLGWNLSDVMVLYWAESAIIGLFNVAKIAVVGRWMALLAGPFFVGHFGAFMAVHFLFIYTIFVEGFSGSGPTGNLAEVAATFAGLWPALLALTLSHGFSFFANFIGRSEYRDRSVQKQMNEPYGRIVFMHLVLIFGGGLAMVLGGPTIVILIVIVLKVVFDIRAHLRQRRPSAASTGS